QLSGNRVQDFISESHGSALSFGHARADRELVVESRRTLVAARGLGDDDEAVVLDFHLLVLESKLAAKLDAAHFEPREVISIIDQPHLVGFRVSNAHGCLSVRSHRERPSVLSIWARAFQETRKALRGNRSSSEYQRFREPLARLPCAARPHRSSAASVSSGRRSLGSMRAGKPRVHGYARRAFLVERFQSPFPDEAPRPHR